VDALTRITIPNTRRPSTEKRRSVVAVFIA
jgi:hypothetical protein